MTIYDIIYKRYLQCGSIAGTAKLLNISPGVVQKSLISSGDYKTATSEQIKDLHDLGFTKAEIISKLGISKSCYNVNSPYSRGSYHEFPKSSNARRISACRKRKEQKKC